eukprot:Sspe_Gene.59821::Locus_32893_Transcript_2_3_Confidence_0.500_Length_1824::g.59821::m.59821/K15779/PGM2; phosphoglucomutase / phosphopentomutase
MDADLKAAVDQWLRWDDNPETRKAVEEAVERKDIAELKKMFKGRVQFGTAGLRAEMGAGTARMNDVTVRQATRGLVEYVKREIPGDEVTVVVGHDARRNSSRWARVVRAVCEQHGVKCQLFGDQVPTPMVAFTTGKLGAQCGVMITASHNPKDDNGYKVYWGPTKAQILPPHDTGIATSIESEVASDRPVSIDGAEGNLDTAEMIEAYLAAISPLKVPGIPPDAVRMVYTPVHGVGLDLVLKAFASFALPAPVVVAQQAQPDGTFPTAPFPNPEEAGVLDLAMSTADSHSIPLVLANDPDADRLAVAEKTKDGWKMLSGNDLGALLGHWAWETGGGDHFLASTVSSRFLESMARAEGLHFEDTLTGFKWMGTRAHELDCAGKRVAFAFEEAIGYMMGAPKIWDKDGVSAAVAAAQMALRTYAAGSTLHERLAGLYAKYGHHASINSYVLSDCPQKTDRLFADLREALQKPDALGERYPILGVRDLTNGTDTRQPDGKAKLPQVDSHMITVYFANSAVLTFRTSGTEPKIKYYSELVSRESFEEAMASLRELIDEVHGKWLRVEHYGFQPPRK